MAYRCNNLTDKIRAPWLKDAGLVPTSETVTGYGNDNDFPVKWKTAAGTSDVEAIRVDSGDQVRLAEEAIKPAWKPITYAVTANGSLGDTAFFIAGRQYTVKAISYVHKTAGNHASAVTLNVTKDTGTTAAGAGTSLQSGTFNCKATANVVQNATLTSTAADLELAAGDRLSVNFTGTLTTLAGVVVTVWVTPSYKTTTANYYVKANGDLVTQTFFVANRDMTISSVRLMYGTAFAAAVTIDVTKDTGTNAPGAGTSVLSAAMAGDSTANTVITGSLSATASVLTLAAGDRLAVKYSATTTGTDVVLCVTFSPIYRESPVTFQLGPNGQMAVDQCFFIADRDYEVVDVSEVHKTAAGGAQKLLVTIDKGTTAPGAGNAVITDNTSAGFDTNGTANTVQVGTLGSRRNRLLFAGDRLGLKWTGAAQSTACVAITAQLRPL